MKCNIKTKFKKTVAAVLTLSMAASLAACGGKKNSDNGKIKLVIGDWPTESRAEAVATFDEKKATFEKMYPQYEIVPDTYVFDTKTYVMKASAGTLPHVLNVPFTEISKNIKNGYCSDISKEMQEFGWTEYINPQIADLISSEGGIYAIPNSAYFRSFGINKKLFVEAGLVNADGSIKTPQTWQEVAEYGQIIKQKTGKAGLVLGTTSNIGGWDFLNLAWDFGVNFMKEGDGGKYIATFDSPECRDAFRYVYDLKWKYDVFPDETVVDNTEREKLFGTYNAAMTYMNAPGSNCVIKYQMDKDDIIIIGVPEGPAGRYRQLGGSVKMFAADMTSEEIKGCLEWLKFNGAGPKELTDEELKSYEDNLSMNVSEGTLVMDKDALPLWINDDPKKTAVRLKYVNVNMDNYAEYFKFEGEPRPEEPVCCQELYGVLDGCIQEILTNKNVDIDALVKKAANDFQVNYLDKA